MSNFSVFGSSSKTETNMLVSPSGAMSSVPSLATVSTFARVSPSFSPEDVSTRQQSCPFGTPSYPPSVASRQPLVDRTNRIPEYSTERAMNLPSSHASSKSRFSFALKTSSVTGTGATVSDQGKDPESPWFAFPFAQPRMSPSGELQRYPTSCVTQQAPPAMANPQPTHHLCISNLKSNMEVRVLVNFLETTGDIKMTYPDFLYSSGTLTVSFYDVRNAAQAYLELEKVFELNQYSGAHVDYATDAKVALMYNLAPSSASIENVLVVTLHGSTERLDSFDYKGFFEAWGALQSASQVELTALRKVVQLTFCDERAASNAFTDMNNQMYQGIAFQIHRCSQQGAPLSERNSATSSFHPWPVAPVWNKQKLDQAPVPSRFARQHPDPGSQRPLLPGGAASGTSFYGDDTDDGMFVTNFTSLNVAESEAAPEQSMSYFCENRNSSVTPFSLFAKDVPKEFLQHGLAERQKDNLSSAFATFPFADQSLNEPQPIYPSIGSNRSLQVDHSTTSQYHTLETAENSDDMTICSETASAQHDNAMVLDNTFDLQRVISGVDKRTTFMIRNIPNKYTQKMLKECIDATHKGTYDFLYLRIDFQNKCNVGYAFINFIDVKSVISFAKERVGKKWNRFNSEKRCSLSYANIQGIDALIEKFRNSTVMEEDESYRPKIFISSGPRIGEEQSFPPPTYPADRRRQTRRRRDTMLSLVSHTERR